MRTTKTPNPVEKQTKLQDFFEKVYLPEYMREKKPSYRQAYCRSIERFVAFLRGDKLISELSSATFKAYKDWHQECHRGAPSTAASDVIRVRRVLVAAGRCELRHKNSHLGVKREAPENVPLEIGKFFKKVYCVQKTISPKYAQQMEITLRSLRRFHKRDVLFDELPIVINRWLAHLELKLAPRTLKGRRATIICLWYAAADEGVCDPPDIRKIRKVKVNRPTPDAWTLEEFQKIVDAAQEFRNDWYRNGINRADYWDAFARVCYDTALRRGDMLAIKCSDVETTTQGTFLRTVQSKTGDGIIHRLNPKTAEAVQKIMTPKRDVLFDFPHTVRAFHDHWKDMLDKAGQDPLNRRNGVQKIRRTSASLLEAKHPGAATAHLGHRCADMARMHYLDPKVSRGDVPTPPALS